MRTLHTLICLLLLSSPGAAGLDLVAPLPADRSPPSSAPRSGQSPARIRDSIQGRIIYFGPVRLDFNMKSCKNVDMRNKRRFQTLKSTTAERDKDAP